MAAGSHHYVLVAFSRHSIGIKVSALSALGLTLGCQNVGVDMFIASLDLYQFVVQFQPKQNHHSRLLLRKSNVTFAEQKTTMG